MNPPKISVIIPVYNVSDYLDKCLWSVVNQTFKEIEILIVNDGSTDNSLSVIENYSSLDSRIKVINQENKGVVNARNSGLAIATGEYIHYVDGDDFLELNCYEEMYRVAKESGADMTFLKFWFQNGEDLEESKSYEKDELDRLSLLSRIWRTSLYNCIWQFLHKRSLYDNDIQSDENLTIGEDAYLTTQLIYYSQKIVTMEVPFYHYVLRSTSVMGSSTIDTKIKELYAYINRICDFMKQKKEHEQVERLLNTLPAIALHISIREYCFNGCRSRCRQVREIHKKYPELYEDAEMVYLSKLIRVFAFSGWLGRIYAQYYILKKKI